MKLQILLSLVTVLVVTGAASAGHIIINNTQTWEGGFTLAAGDVLEIGPTGNLSVTGLGQMSGGAELIVNGGTITYTHERLNVNDAAIIVNGGLAKFNVEDEIKFGDDWGPSYLYLNGGVFDCNSFELNYLREPHFIVGGGIYQVRNEENDPQGYIDHGGVVELAPGYVELVVEWIVESDDIYYYRLSAKPGLVPTPDNGEINVPVDIVLNWTVNPLATSYDVYFGDSRDDIDNADNSLPLGTSVYKANTTGTSYDPEQDLEMGKTYYWRIDEVAGGSVTKGWIWKFTTVGSAYNPSPKDQGNTPIEVSLTWTSGQGAQSHDVYFGGTYEEVYNADNSMPVGTSAFKGNQSSNTYSPGVLTFGHRYYWRIDELSAGKNIKGAVWSFNVSDYLVVDDIESYTDPDELSEAWTAVGGTWLELSTKRSGPHILYHKYHDGIQSMTLIYYNISPYKHSAVERTFPEVQDWTKGQIKSMALFFLGEASNSADTLYAAVEDNLHNRAMVTYDGDDNDLKSEEWLEWRIDLKDFSDAGVDLAAVKKFAVGVGTPDGSSSGSTGYLFIDDIRLYPTICVPEDAPPGDLNDDCIINFEDFGLVGKCWMENDFVEGVTPNPANLRLWYEFDETSGSDIGDSSGNNFDGVLTVGDANSSADEASWKPEGKFGGCIMFDTFLYGYAIEVPNEVFSTVTNQMTVSLWVNWEDPTTMPEPSHHIFDMHGGPGEQYERILGIETAWPSGHVRFRDSKQEAFYQAQEQDWAHSWRHYAFVKNNDREYIRIYLDGKIVAEAHSTAPINLPVDLARIGAATDEWHDQYTGLVDDFRIYDYALSQAEVLGLASGSGADIPIPSRVRANLNKTDHVIDLKDLAIMAGNWLSDARWP